MTTKKHLEEEEEVSKHCFIFIFWIEGGRDRSDLGELKKKKEEMNKCFAVLLFILGKKIKSHSTVHAERRQG